MLFQASKVIWTLLLLNIGLCLALRGIIPAPPNKHGVRFISAICGNKLHTFKTIQNAIQNRLSAMNEQGQINGELTRYYPKPNENLPIKGLYFSTYIDIRNMDRKRDMVVFTGKGQLVKVVSQVRDESSIPNPKAGQWRIEDCRLKPQLIISPLIPHEYLQ